jgi:hypothetical protein
VTARPAAVGRSGGLPVRLGWAALVVVAMVGMTRGLWATVHFEPTAEALAAEQRGELWVLVASGLLAAAAYVARRAWRAPWWVVVAVAAPIVLCGGITLTGAVGVLSLVVAYPVVLAGLVGGLLARR